MIAVSWPGEVFTIDVFFPVVSTDLCSVNSGFKPVEPMPISIDVVHLHGIEHDAKSHVRRKPIRAMSAIGVVIQYLRRRGANIGPQPASIWRTIPSTGVTC